MRWDTTTIINEPKKRKTWWSFLEVTHIALISCTFCKLIDIFSFWMGGVYEMASTCEPCLLPFTINFSSRALSFYQSFFIIIHLYCHNVFFNIFLLSLFYFLFYFLFCCFLPFFVFRLLLPQKHWIFFLFGWNVVSCWTDCLCEQWFYFHYLCWIVHQFRSSPFPTNPTNSYTKSTVRRLVVFKRMHNAST